MTLFEWDDNVKSYINSRIDGWEGGSVYHTSGNIYVREWNRYLPNGNKVEVGYSNQNGIVGINVYDGEGNGEGPIDSFSIEVERNTDIAFGIMAKALMERINCEGIESFE